MSDTNRFGLKRGSLSTSIKLEIRRQAGFGCVVCGNAIGEYEHIDPPFGEAESHDPDRMTFLCSQCHAKVTRGHLSKESIIHAKNNPASKRKGFSFEAFDTGLKHPDIYIGNLKFIGCEICIRVNGRKILWINPPEINGGPFRLNAELRGGDGALAFSIIDNEWRVRTENWDVVVQGSRIIIRNGPGLIALILRTCPPSHVHIERINMLIEGHRIIGRDEVFKVITRGGHSISAQSGEISGSHIALDINNNSVSFGMGGNLLFRNFQMKNTNTLRMDVDKSIRRNARCLCGSGLRYKNCCGSFRLY